MAQTKHNECVRDISGIKSRAYQKLETKGANTSRVLNIQTQTQRHRQTDTHTLITVHHISHNQSTWKVYQEVQV